MDLRDPGRWSVAKPRVPNVLCGKCGTRFTWKQISEITKEHNTECKKCGTFAHCFNVDVDVRADNEYLLWETPRYWWHITERADWAKNVPLLDKFVHVGTPQTVRLYHDTLVKSKDWKTVFDTIPFVTYGLHLYRVELPPTLTVDPKIARDYNNWPVYICDAEVGPHAYKYVNSVEVPGSISLLVPYADLTNITEVSNFSTRTTSKEA